MQTQPVHYRDRWIAGWLIFNAVMVLAMAVIGAITRLTESGLSITVWEPLTGWRWPASPEAWQAAFDLYRDTPQYRDIFAGMTLAEFRVIFFWEWFHRLWGRLIGVTFALPLIVFAVKGWIRPHLWPRVLGLLVLGGLQAAMGWYMVQSGLVDRPSVSHYRLAAHLGLALIIFAGLWHTALLVLRPAAGNHAITPGWRGHLWGATALTGVTIVWGAFVAGLDAGLLYPNFPLMGDGPIPPEAWELTPVLLNLVENPATVQLLHRWLGVTTGLVILSLWWRGMQQALTGHQKLVLHGLGLAVLLQIALGIATLYSLVAIPLAAAHQAGAILLLTFLIAALHETRPLPAAAPKSASIQAAGPDIGARAGV